MAALDFPASPTDGQVYGNFIWSTAKGAWQAKPITGKVTTSAVAPSAPSNGDEWFNTNDGNLYVYYTDVDGSQWVQVKSDATLSSTLGNRVTSLEATPSGLVPIVPTSVTVGSGSATVDSLGSITVTGASSISLNNIFTSNYRNYKVVAKLLPASGSVITAFRFRTSGVDNSTASYSNQGTIITGGSIAAINNVGLTSLNSIVGYGTVPSGLSMDFFAPQLAEGTTFSAMSNGHNGSALTYLSYTGYWGSSTQFDGISILPSASTLTGTIQVYGYR